MTVAILGIVGTVLSIAFYLIRRANNKADDPIENNLQRKAAADAAVAAGDRGVDAVNLQLDDALRRLRAAGSDTSRPDCHVPESWSNHHSPDGSLSSAAGADAGNPARTGGQGTAP